MSASITYHPPMYTAMLYLRYVTAVKLKWFSTWYNCSCRLVVYGAVETVHTNSSSTSRYLAYRTKALVPKRTDLVGYGTTFTKREISRTILGYFFYSYEYKYFPQIDSASVKCQVVVSFACFFYFETGNSGRPANFLVISSRTAGRPR